MSSGERHYERYTLQFGWPGDEGLGEALISQVENGVKTATCAPKFEYSEEELRELAWLVETGEPVAVVDREEAPRCRVRMVAVYETTFGDPDTRLVRGEGYGDEAAAFKREHREVWAEELAAEGAPLTDATVLVVEEFELLS